MENLSRKQIANLWMGTFFVMFTVFLMAGINPVCAQTFWWAGNCENSTIGDGGSQTILSASSYTLYSDAVFYPQAAPFNGHSTVEPYYASWLGGPWVGYAPSEPVLVNGSDGLTVYHLFLYMLPAGDTCEDCNCSEPSPTPTPYPFPTGPGPWNGTIPISPGNLTFPNNSWVGWTNYTIFTNVTTFENFSITNRTNLTNYFNQTLMPMVVVNSWLNFWDWIFSSLFSFLQRILDFILSPIRWIISMFQALDQAFYDTLNGLLYFLKPISMFFQKFFYIVPPAIILIGTFMLILDFIWWILKGRKT